MFLGLGPDCCHLTRVLSPLTTSKKLSSVLIAIVGGLSLAGCSSDTRHQGPIQLVSTDGPPARLALVVVGPTIDAIRKELSVEPAKSQLLKVLNLCSEMQCWPNVASHPGEEYVATVAGTRCGPLSFYSASVTRDLVLLTFRYKSNQCGGAAAQSPFQPLDLFSLKAPIGSALPNNVRIVSYGQTYSAQVAGSF